MEIEIYGRPYKIDVNSSDELYFSGLARFVDQKMREIAETSNIADTSKLAVLTALNIADDYYRLKDTKDNTKEVINKKMEDLVALINTVVEK